MGSPVRCPAPPRFGPLPEATPGATRHRCPALRLTQRTPPPTQAHRQSGRPDGFQQENTAASQPPPPLAPEILRHCPRPEAPAADQECSSTLVDSGHHRTPPDHPHTEQAARVHRRADSTESPQPVPRGSPPEASPPCPPAPRHRRRRARPPPRHSATAAAEPLQVRSPRRP